MPADTTYPCPAPFNCPICEGPIVQTAPGRIRCPRCADPAPAEAEPFAKVTSADPVPGYECGICDGPVVPVTTEMGDQHFCPACKVVQWPRYNHPARRRVKAAAAALRFLEALGGDWIDGGQRIRGADAGLLDRQRARR